MVRSKDARGFTLIELLVVISIIGMLSSVVMASLSGARSKARIAAGITFDTHTSLALNEYKLVEFDFSTSATTCSGGNISSIRDISGALPTKELTTALSVSCGSLTTDSPFSTPHRSYRRIGGNAGDLYTDQYINFGGPSLTALSYSFWVRCPSGASGPIVHSPSLSGGYAIVSDGSTVRTIRTPSNGNWTPIETFNTFSTGSICDNNWHHLLVSFAPSRAQVYIDGHLEQTVSVSYTMVEYNYVAFEGTAAPFDIAHFIAYRTDLP